MRIPLKPVIGAFFTKDNNKPGADKVIVLTQSYWQTQYQERPEVLGAEVRHLDDLRQHRVIGSVPPGPFLFLVLRVAGS